MEIPKQHNEIITRNEFHSKRPRPPPSELSPKVFIIVYAIFVMPCSCRCEHIYSKACTTYQVIQKLVCIMLHSMYYSLPTGSESQCAKYSNVTNKLVSPWGLCCTRPCAFTLRCHICRVVRGIHPWRYLFCEQLSRRKRG